MNDEEREKMVAGVAACRAGFDQLLAEMRAAGVDAATVADLTKKADTAAAYVLWLEHRVLFPSTRAFLDGADVEVFGMLASLLGDDWLDTAWRWAETELGEVRPS